MFVCRVNMNQVDHDFHWNVFESTDFVKINISKYFFAIEMLLTFFGRMVFKVS